jgi:hypothetical protein
MQQQLRGNCEPAGNRLGIPIQGLQPGKYDQYMLPVFQSEFTHLVAGHREQEIVLGKPPLTSLKPWLRIVIERFAAMLPQPRFPLGAR